jgi:prolyl-tRNA synthetase
MQGELLQRATALRASRTTEIDDLATFERFFREQGGGFAHCFWCGDGACEKKLAEKYKTTIRNIPLGAKAEAGKCIHCDKPAEQRVVMAQAY